MNTYKYLHTAAPDPRLKLLDQCFCCFRFVCLFGFLQYLGIPEWGVTKNEQRGLQNKHGERENVKWEPSRELEMKLLIGRGLELGFFPIFHFPVPHLSNIFPETGRCFPTCASFDKILLRIQMTSALW